jgi:hypothetical protein
LAPERAAILPQPDRRRITTSRQQMGLLAALLLRAERSASCPFIDW